MKNKEEKSCLLSYPSRAIKKMMIVLFAMLFLVSAACEAAVFAPEWTEFCPPKYCESKENAFSKDATYWYKRRMQFNKALATCSAYHGTELDSCYAEIRAAEDRKNQVWAVRQEEKYRTTEYNREYYMEKMRYDGINQMIENIKR